MLVADILHSCRHEDVAAAAVSSIGGDFAIAIRAEAGRSELSVGGLMAALVAGFVIDAAERDWRDLTAIMAGEDLPVLSGLRHIGERMLKARHETARRRSWLRREPDQVSVPAAVIAAVSAQR